MRIRSGFNYTLILPLLALLVSPTLGKIIYVDDDAPPPGDGTSWTAAYRFLQDALADANDSEQPVEIRVAQGIYKPDQGASQIPGDHWARFQVQGGIELKGGFAGLGQSDPNAHDIGVYQTILSGDLKGDDLPVVRATDMRPDLNRMENSLWVVTVHDPNGTAVINGFMITGGDNVVAWSFPGAGVGLFCYRDSTPTICNCTFIANFASGNYGGAIFGGTPKIINCVFDRNLAERGGAISTCGGLIKGCLFVGNVANQRGGALYECTGTVTNCVFVGNSAEEGGAVSLESEGDLALSNCTSSWNNALVGRTLSCGSYGPGDPVAVSLANCILWNGGDEIRSFADSTVEVRYCDLQGGQAALYDPCESITWDQGNIDVDPCFVDPGYWDANGTPDDPNDDFFVEGDYHLMSEAGRWDPNVGAWVRDDVTSPCIDAGDPNSDVAGEVWPHGGRINMGVYGGTSQASLSAEPSDMFLPRIACIYWYDSQLAESFQSFLQAYGCPVTLIRSEDIIGHPLDDYDLILIATDTPSPAVWSDEQAVAPLVESGKPILGLGEGGYRFFGKLDMTIGHPNGAHNNYESVQIVDPSSPFCGAPYPVAIPEDEILQLYTTAVENVVIYLWPAPPEDVTMLARQVSSSSYYPLVAEQGHLLWGFTDPPEQMTEAGRQLFLNAVILTANRLLQPETAPMP